MHCRIAEMRYKEVINVCNGHRLGYVCDVQIDTGNGRLVSIVIPGPCRFLGLFGREEDYIIPWDCIQRIGEDIILVEVSGSYKRGKKNRRGML